MLSIPSPRVTPEDTGSLTSSMGNRSNKQDLVISIGAIRSVLSQPSSSSTSSVDITSSSPTQSETSLTTSNRISSALAEPEPSALPHTISHNISNHTLIPQPSSWIALPNPRPTTPSLMNRRSTVRRTSSLRLLASGNGASPKPSQRANSLSMSHGSPVMSVYRDRSSMSTIGSIIDPKKRMVTHGPSSSSLSNSKPISGLTSLAGKPKFIPPKMYLSSLTRIGGKVESPYFKYEVQLLHQIYFSGIIEEQVVRHIELLLSTSRPGAMHANLRAAFEWYQGHITRGIPEMMELARRVRVFASYNIYFCKIMGWTCMWLEVSSHTNVSTSQVTKNYCYNPHGELPPYPPLESHSDSEEEEEGVNGSIQDIGNSEDMMGTDI